MMLQVLVTYVAGFASYLTINHLWLGVIGRNFYIDKLKEHTIIKKSRLVPYVPAVLCLLCVGITCLLVLLLTVVTSDTEAFLFGAGLGFALYSFHNLFNLTLLKEHSWGLAIVDTVYGTLTLSAVSTIMYLAKELFV